MYSQQQQYPYIGNQSNQIIGDYDEKKDKYEPSTKTNSLKPLDWNQSLQKNKTNVKVFIWGKAIPRNMFPHNQDELTPWKSDNLSSKQIYNITAARQGSHCFGIGKHNWCFVWGETKQVGALGLGTNSRSTSPFILTTFIKQRVTQACCSAVHSLCITDAMVIYGWGNKLLTLLQTDTTSPTPLNYLNGKNLNKLCASNTHSLAYNTDSVEIYAFGKTGAWLGLDDDNHDKKQSFGMVKFDSLVTNNKELRIRNADCSSHYTVIILNNGYFGCCGINKHGRMGVGKSIECTSKVIWNMDLRDIILCSAGSFHCGFIDTYGNVYTCGDGADYRHGHGHTKTLWKPQQINIEACHKLQIKPKVCEIECVGARTYVITSNGDLIMYGKEPIIGRIHKQGFIYNYLSPYKIYKICGAKDFCVAIGVNRKKEVVKPNINIPNDVVDSINPNEIMNNTNSLIGSVLNKYHTKCVDEGNSVDNVIGNFVKLKQVKYDNDNNNAYSPPMIMNVVYGGMNIPPPPPPLRHGQNQPQSYLYNAAQFGGYNGNYVPK